MNSWKLQHLEILLCNELHFVKFIWISFMPHFQVGISAGASGLQRTEGTTLFQASTQQATEDWVSPKGGSDTHSQYISTQHADAVKTVSRSEGGSKSGFMVSMVVFVPYWFVICYLQTLGMLSPSKWRKHGVPRSSEILEDRILVVPTFFWCASAKAAYLDIARMWSRTSVACRYGCHGVGT